MPAITPTASIDTAMSSPGFYGSMTSPRYARSRTESLSSDRPSTIAHSLMSAPLSVTPEAAFMAASAASQIVTNDHDTHSETWYDQAGIEPLGETALVSHGALQLANNFVDQLLFNIIVVARSTSLSALRAAVSEVLKPKLAKDAVNQAEEELREYLGGGEVEDLMPSPVSQAARDWDSELVWKRTRLRCMVYSSLGDMEEEDEDYFMEQEHLNGEADDLTSDGVSPAVAIFLTSILEYIGEQVLVVAGQASFNRLRVRYEKELKDGTRSVGDLSDRIVVEDLDMERVALDRTLGRLWRSWKKRIRSPAEPNFSRMHTRSANHSRHGSAATETIHGIPTPQDAPEQEEPVGRQLEGADVTDHILEPTEIPLPLSANDVAEIEVPGLVFYSDDEASDADDEDEGIVLPTRPKSLMIFAYQPIHSGPPSPGLSQPHTPVQATRRRANSLPTPDASPYKSPKPIEADSEQTEKEQDAPRHARDIPEIITTDAGLSPARAVRQVNEDGVSPLDTEVEDEGRGYLRGDASTTRPVSFGIADAAAFGAATSGVPVMHEFTPEYVPTPLEEEPADETEIESDDMGDSEEEPQILTGSRISIGGSLGGRSNSPTASDSGRPLSILPTRSSSVRSVRMIDVQSPRSPSITSRSSTDPMELGMRPASISREASSSTPPIVEENGDSDVPSIRASHRNAFIPPAVEHFREARGMHQPSSTSVPRTSRSAAPTSVPSAALPPQVRSQAQIQAPEPAPMSGGTKVTILSPPPPPGRSFLELDTKPETPQKSPVSQKQPSMPTVPEKSPSRPEFRQSPPARQTSFDRNQTAIQRAPESPRTSRSKVTDSPSSASSARPKAIRSSEENPHRAQDVARNFEALLQNDQTLQYTLTPENMRNMDVPSPIQSNRNVSPAAGHKSRRSEDVKQPERNRASSIKRSLSVSKTTGLHSHPPESQTNGNEGTKLTGPVPRAPPVSMTNFHNRSTAQARDARVPRESLADFADFIRSTGPPSGGNPAARIVAAPAQPHARNASGSAHPTNYNSSRDAGRPQQGSVNRARLQARDAVISPNNESSDLIDFIRRGPPNSDNQPRIPRTVAPFRTTMDSDQLQMSGASGGRAVDAVIPDIRDSQASASVTGNSVHSSINSQSALLSKARKPAQYSNNFEDEDMMPQRKQRRVRDPYAIDSDEEADDFDATPVPRSKPKKEESLIDFLNSYEPPSNPATPQPFITSQKPQVMPKKKSSAPNLLSRLRTGGSVSMSATNRKPVAQGSNGANSSRAPDAQYNDARGHAPINVQINRGPNQNGNFPPVTNRAVSNSSGRVPMKKFEPREAVSSNTTRTSDLAKFLRDSEPPPQALASPISPTGGERSRGFGRMFDRRKNSSVY